MHKEGEMGCKGCQQRKAEFKKKLEIAAKEGGEEVEKKSPTRKEMLKIRKKARIRRAAARRERSAMRAKSKEIAARKTSELDKETQAMIIMETAKAKAREERKTV